ncbi:hypothetical protein PAT3040_02709 [Paenibacillus agaridevorans]|uniref:Uncharacterized protein n=1 Tax=Paenibacillus agaridevorans TaxID=171404 RepID=A0A2R5EXR1_9BACL|nr:hypothetical protein PAT3040_02709 [Paenibacillus agaridevorans]
MLVDYKIYESFSVDIKSKPFDFLVYLLILGFCILFNNRKDYQYKLMFNSVLVATFTNGIAISSKYLDGISTYFSIYVIF